MSLAQVYYPNGSYQEKEYSSNSTRLHGLRLEDQRPLRIVLLDSPTQEMVVSCQRAVHPLRGTVEVVDD